MGKASEFSLAQKKEILLYRQSHIESGQRISNRALTLWANAKFQASSSEMSISRLLKRKDLLDLDIEAPPTIKRVRKVYCPQVENATFSWFTLMQEHGATITDDLLIAAAKKFYNMSQKDPSQKELQFSNGWLEGFKRRFKIKGYTRHGEAGSADNSPEALQRMEQIKLICSRYQVSDIFNMDETGLFYRLEPNRTLATHRLSGRKKQKERLTIALTSNADGSIKLPPFVINKFVKPRAFSQRNIVNPQNLGILWAANKKAWMTT